MRVALALTATVLLGVSPALAQKKYDPGASDTEIKIGQTMPYSGPASGFSISARVAAAYYKALNGHGGVNGRTITMISLYDGYSPPKTVELARRLVEQDEVLALFGSLGTPTNVAVRKYLNQKKIPQLLEQCPEAGDQSEEPADRNAARRCQHRYIARQLPAIQQRPAYPL
jgi:ABC-type branched-subunit amino acid transport system substrate-binding protein